MLHRLAVTTFALAAATQAVTAPALAQGLSPVWVQGEDETPSLRQCSLTYSSAVAAIESALRYNRVTVGTKDDWLADKALRFYVNLSALRSEYTSGRLADSCAIHVSVARLLTMG